MNLKEKNEEKTHTKIYRFVCERYLCAGTDSINMPEH